MTLAQAGPPRSVGVARDLYRLMKATTTILALCVAALLSLGMVVLFSSNLTLGSAATAAADGWRAWQRDPAIWQLFWLILGLGAAALVAAVDYRWLQRVWWLPYAVAVGLLVWVLVKGIASHGATRWLRIGPVSLQPSEFAKLALIIALAYYAQRYPHQMRTFVRGLVIPCAMSGVLLVLIFLEPDWGATLLLAAVTGVLLLVAGVRWVHLMPPVLVGTAVLGVFLAQNPLRLNRILSWLDLEATKEGVGYQAYQAQLALGSGGWTGVGLGNGEQYSYVLESQTDFIYSLAGEELGLVCTGGVVVAFVVLVLCGSWIARNARELFGSLLATGITFLIGLQALINMGVVTGLLPNKGLPLPFVSRGGSNLLVLLVAVGLLFSVARCSARGRPDVQPTAELEEMPSPQAC